MGRTQIEEAMYRIENQTPRENIEELKKYRKIYGELNPLYNDCGSCQYEDEYGCWQKSCKRMCTSKYEADRCRDMQRDTSLPWIPIEDN